MGERERSILLIQECIFGAVVNLVKEMLLLC